MHINFLCPKNFKNGYYILNKYKPIDLLILIAGGIIGLIVLLTMITIGTSLKMMVVSILGLFIGATIFLVALMLTHVYGYHHNVLCYLLAIMAYYGRRKRFIWKGVDYTYEEGENA